MSTNPIDINDASLWDYQVHTFPVSVKGVVVFKAKVILLINERDEWELPGGKLEFGEDPEDTVIREIKEELGLDVTLGPLIDCWNYKFSADRQIVIVTYGCHANDLTELVHSAEHKAVSSFKIDEIENLNMPSGYKRSIYKWVETLK